MANDMVNHRVRIVLKPLDKKLISKQVMSAKSKLNQVEPGNLRAMGSYLFAWLERVASVIELLTAEGWTCRGDWREIILENDEIEAYQAKEMMVVNGFSPVEFEIRLEYVRKWGVL